MREHFEKRGLGESSATPGKPDATAAALETRRPERRRITALCRPPNADGSKAQRSPHRARARANSQEAPSPKTSAKGTRTPPSSCQETRFEATSIERTTPFHTKPTADKRILQAGCGRIPTGRPILASQKHRTRRRFCETACTGSFLRAQYSKFRTFVLVEKQKNRVRTAPDSASKSHAPYSGQRKGQLPNAPAQLQAIGKQDATSSFSWRWPAA